MKKTITALTLALLAFGTQDQAASWQARSAEIDFLSIKVNQQKGSVTEESNFSSSTARLAEDGAFTMDIDLNSVSTNVELRDQRLRDWVFETARFARATISGKVDIAAVDKLAVGQAIRLEQPLKLEIHGTTTDIDAELNVHRVAEDRIVVSTLKPVILDIKELGMTEGIGKLVEVMGLLSIVEQVPVSFSGEFTRQP